MQGVFSNVNHLYLFLMIFHPMIFHPMSLHCKLVPAQKEYQFGPLKNKSMITRVPDRFCICCFFNSWSHLSVRTWSFMNKSLKQEVSVCHLSVRMWSLLNKPLKQEIKNHWNRKSETTETRSQKLLKWEVLVCHLHIIYIRLGCLLHWCNPCFWQNDKSSKKSLPFSFVNS